MSQNLLLKAVFASIIATSSMAIAPPVFAADIVVQFGPPALRYERVPDARRGYTWAPGYWDYQRNQHVWKRGNWKRNREGYVYQQPNWEERDGRWNLRRGDWNRRDRDGDGVPNRQDNHPNDPNRR